MSEPPTRFAVLTPPGAAAVAVIELAGPQAWDVVRERFRPAAATALPAVPDADRFWLGQFGGPPGDTVVLSVRAGGFEPHIELHCHGGPEVVRLLTAELARAGVVPGLAGDFASGMQPDAVAELTRAPTLRTASILLDQLGGAFGRAVAALTAAVTAADLAAAQTLALELARYGTVGRHLTRPWRVAVIGPPNVGKSSLVNTLAGYRRSVVTPVPGTTRDVVTTATAIDGWPVELIDTAGQHDAADDLEGQGIARARSAAAAADLCLWVADVTTPPAAGPAGCLLVVNKSDLEPVWDVAAVPAAVVVSARTGAGLDRLCARVSRRLVSDPPPSGAAVPFTPELADRVAEVAAAIDSGDLSAAGRSLAPLLASLQPMPPA